MAKLKDVQCKNAVCDPGKVVRKLADGNGLFLFVTPDGAKRWRYRYMVQGINRKGESAQIEKLLSVGVYPETTLAQARDKAAELRKIPDPGEARKATKQAETVAASNTLESVARAWHSKHKSHWSESYADDLIAGLERHVFPLIGGQPIDGLTSANIMTVLERIEASGALNTAHRMLPILGRIFAYGKSKGLCQYVITADISKKDALQKTTVKKHPAVNLKELPALLRKINDYDNQPIKLTLQMVFLTFVRVSELLQAKWDEFDLENAMWRIPEARMKKRLALLVPLSTQALTVLKQLKAIGCGSDYVFPGRSYEKPLTSQSLINHFGLLGYGGIQTSHGARRIASTILNEACDEDDRPLFNSDAIERQLAHTKMSVREIYNEAQYLNQRKKMMQWWADYLDAKAKEGITENQTV